MGDTGAPRRVRLNDGAALTAAYSPRGTGTAQFLWDAGRSAIPGFGLKMTPSAVAGRAEGKAWRLLLGSGVMGAGLGSVAAGRL